MVTKAASDVPAEMQGVYRRFERWRGLHQARVPIPEALWTAATELARQHGVFRTAKALRLEYGKLKRLVGGEPSKKRMRAPGARFLELVSPSGIAFGAGVSECLIELEGPRGKMRIQWKGATAPDLAGLSRVLWESA